MKKQIKRYDITQCALYKCKSSNKLKRILKISDEEYENINDYIKYYKFDINKKDNSEKREITAPNVRIKEIQTRILRLTQKISRPEWLISGEKGKSYIDNGKKHINSNYFLAIDIKKFYDNCNREYVFRFFKDKMLMAGDLAGLCTDIVTYNGGIPTGCPTSQMMAYYAYEDMFKEINRLACLYGCIFTLYVDDMTISSEKPFVVSKVKNGVDIILRKYGHKPKYKKVKYYGKGKNVPVTGVVITCDHKMTVPNTQQKKIYDDFQEIKNMKDIMCAEDKTEKLSSLRGRVQAARNIEPSKFPEIKRLTDLL